MSPTHPTPKIADDPLLPLLAPVTGLRGVGPALAKLIERVAGGGRVLDLGCGTGRLTVALAAAGHRVRLDRPSRAPSTT